MMEDNYSGAARIVPRFNDMSYILGIDFGTSNTVVSLLKTFVQEPSIVRIDGEDSIPSVVRMDPTGEYGEAFGKEALAGMEKYPDRTFVEFKLGWGKPEVSNETRTRTREFLRLMREAIERQQFNGAPISESVSVVVGMPSGWGSFADGLKGVFSAAGYPEVTLIAEPLAAALYHLKVFDDLKLGKDRKVVVVDCGGGTTDLSVVTWASNSCFPVPKPIGGFEIAGSNFDRVIAGFLRNRFNLNEEEKMLTARAKKAKEELSAAAECEVCSYDKVTASRRIIKLNKNEMETFCTGLLSDFSKAVMRCLEDGRVDLKDIDYVLAVGGMSRSPMIADVLKGTLVRYSPDKMLESGSPTDAVALGLSLSDHSVSQLADKLGARIKDALGKKEKGKSLEDEVWSLLTSVSTKDRFDKAIRNAVDKAWSDVNLRELIGSRFHWSKTKRAEAFARTKSAMALKEQMDLHLGEEIKKLMNEIRIMIDRRVNQAVKDALSEMEGFMSLCESQLGDNRGPNGVGSECGIGGAAHSFVTNLIVTIVGAVSAAIASTMVVVTTKILFFFAANALNPLALAVVVVGGLAALVTGGKVIDPKGSITKTILKKLTWIPKDGKWSSEEAKSTIYMMIWKPDGNEELGLEATIGRIFDILWNGDPNTKGKKPLREVFISIMKGNLNSNHI